MSTSISRINTPIILEIFKKHSSLDDLAELCYDYDSFVRLLGGHVHIMLNRNIPGESDFILYDPDQDETEEFLSGKTRYYCFDPIMTTEEINILATSGSGSSKSSLIPRTVEKDLEHVKNAKLLALIPGIYEQEELSSQIYHYRIDRMIEIQDVEDVPLANLLVDTFGLE